jgi:hypothetical protein
VAIPAASRRCGFIVTVSRVSPARGDFRGQTRSPNGQPRRARDHNTPRGPVCPVVGQVCQPVRERRWLSVLGVEPGWESLAGWVGAVGPSLIPDKFSNLSHGTVVERVSQPVSAGHPATNRRGRGPTDAWREDEPPCEPPLDVDPRMIVPLGSARRSTVVVHGVG